MPYTRRPFQPETPYANQVSIELNKANDNFDILAQAFVSDNPETFKVKNAEYSDNSDTANNSDKLDGYDASLTPAPNVIVPLNSAGILDLSATYVKSNVYTFRRVNLTGAISDYELQVGEEAYIEFSNATTVPLRIAVPSATCFYQILVVITYISASNFDYLLLPNNTTYGGQFQNYALTLGGNRSFTHDMFFHDLLNGSSDTSPYILIQFVSIGVRSSFVIAGGKNTTTVNYSVWNNTTTPWTSLGSIKSYNGQTLSGYILIRRLR